jgi:hypothetical protein
MTTNKIMNKEFFLPLFNKIMLAIILVYTYKAKIKLSLIYNKKCLSETPPYLDLSSLRCLISKGV